MHNNILSFWQQQQKIKMRTICRNHPVIFPPIPFSAPRDLGLSTFCVIRMVSLLHVSSFTCSWKRYTPLLLEYSNSFFFGCALVAFGILALWPGIEPTPLHWKHGVITTEPPGKSLKFLFKILLYISTKSSLTSTFYFSFHSPKATLKKILLPLKAYRHLRTNPVPSLHGK